MDSITDQRVKLQHPASPDSSLNLVVFRGQWNYWSNDFCRTLQKAASITTVRPAPNILLHGINWFTPLEAMHHFCGTTRLPVIFDIKEDGYKDPVYHLLFAAARSFGSPCVVYMDLRGLDTKTAEVCDLIRNKPKNVVIIIYSQTPWFLPTELLSSFTFRTHAVETRPLLPDPWAKERSAWH